METVKCGIKLPSSAVLAGQSTSFQISFGTSAPAMEIATAEVIALLMLTYCAPTRRRMKEGQIVPLKDRPVSRCFTL